MSRGADYSFLFFRYFRPFFGRFLRCTLGSLVVEVQEAHLVLTRNLHRPEVSAHQTDQKHLGRPRVKVARVVLLLNSVNR